MIDYNEEIKKFYPSTEIGEVEELIYQQDMTDAVDILLETMKNGKV
ncbi:MAG: hypothetical protein LUC95_04155 [Lachnospiraceae bacterium]|nr:hypothetical protein [Lachnospiraceae bacterium]MCD8379520.1 hypothetical protein [Lachnospiraceae bacterium]